MNELELFAGAGGGILAGKLLGWSTVCAVEIEPFCIERLMQRQNEGHLDPFPIWDDIRTFSGYPWRGVVDVISGGFPCQDISVAGKGAGITGERSGLWSEMFRVIREVRPQFVFVENSPTLTSRGLGTVLGDLATIGFDAEWDVFGAHHIGAPHKRDRIWILAHARRQRGDAGACQKIRSKMQESEWPNIDDIRWWSTEPDVGRVAHGVANRVDRLKAIGNGQVPAVAASAFWELMRRIKG